MKLTFLVVSVLLFSTAANAQLVNGINVNNTDMLLSRVIFCGSLKKAGKPLPSTCRTGSSSRSSTPSTTATKPAVKPQPKGSVKFTPVAGDTVFQTFANENGTTNDEKALLLQIANGTKELFKERYGPKGWTNNVAGAFAFFIISNMTVYTGVEPDGAAQNAVFQSMDAAFSDFPDFANASNKGKQDLYNTLIAYSGLPMALYAEAAQKGNRDGLEKAKNLAARYIRMFLKTEPEDLKGLIQP